MQPNELNRILIDEIHKLRSGKIKVDRANATAKLASVIVSQARVVAAVMKMTGTVTADLAIPAPTQRKKLRAAK